MIPLIQCITFAAMISLGTIIDLVVPFYEEINVAGVKISLSNLRCPIVSSGEVETYYNSSGLKIWVNVPMNVNCAINIEINKKQMVLDFVVTSKMGEAIHIVTQPNASDPCFSVSAILNKSDLAPFIGQLKLTPSNPIYDLILLGIQKYFNDLIAKNIKELSKKLTNEFVNHTMAPPNPFPPLRPGALSVEQWPIGRALKHIIRALPLFSSSRITASTPAPTGIEANVTVMESINIDTPRFELHAPKDVRLSIGLGLDMLVCNDAGLDCVISNGLKIPNIRTWGGGEVDRLTNNFLSPMVTKFANDLFATNGTKIPLKTEECTEQPPLWVIIVMGPLLALLAVAAVVYSAYRHIVVSPVLDTFGHPISLRRILIEDSIVSFVCFTGIYMFIWSNFTTAASVSVGGEITTYCFSLTNSVNDMWQAGLYPLSFLIALFSGVYPYVKLLAIVIFSVVRQQPQNKFLRVIDNIGKFSLLDTYVMTIMKTGLDVTGIAEVHSHLSFYMFVTATILSIAMGNYVSHGWRLGTRIRYSEDERENIILRYANSANAINNNNGPSSPSGFVEYETPTCKKNDNQNTTDNTNMIIFKNKEDVVRLGDALVSDHYVTPKDLANLIDKHKWYEVWEWRLTLPCTAAVIAVSLVACVMINLTYRITGISVLVTGDHKSLSLWGLLTACDWFLTIIGLSTIVFIPIVYIVTFPHCKFLSAWCATDCFLVACLAGLLQLEQFISFVIGARYNWVYSARCVLEWPLFLWLVSMAIQWFFIFKQILDISGMPTLQKIKLSFSFGSDDDESTE